MPATDNDTNEQISKHAHAARTLHKVVYTITGNLKHK